MIIKALADYYNYLLASGDVTIAKLGWSSCKVSYLLDILPDGTLCRIVNSSDGRGWQKDVPEILKRTSKVDPNLLCDTPSYFLGIDGKGKPDRAIECFESSRKRHLEFLSGIDSPSANAVMRFFQNWDPRLAMEDHAVRDAGDALLKGGNMVFEVLSGNGFHEVLDDPLIRDAWDNEYMNLDESAEIMTCLVTGERVPIARLHPSIKGVLGAQASGATLIGFNNRSFESYGRFEDQGLNSPVGKRSAFAYGTALNYLLGSKDHRIRIGDTTVVFWADRNDLIASRLVSNLLDPQYSSSRTDDVKGDSDTLIASVMEKISSGKPIADVDLESEFYMLGLAPNSARLSVRFFEHNSFGAILKNIQSHYARTETTRAPNDKRYLSPYRLLKSVENPNATGSVFSSELSGGLMRSILGDRPYPVGLFEAALLRTRASQDNEEKRFKKVTRERAAIARAFLIKNRNKSQEEITVALNEERDDIPYVLGRIFAVAESAQTAANPSLNSNLKNKYYDSASSMPNAIFPIVIKLSEKSLAKLKRDQK